MGLRNSLLNLVGHWRRSFEIGGTFGGTAPRRVTSRRRIGPVLYSKSGADGRIRTGDPLFTNQAAIEFSGKFWLSMYS
jgi:hypothetical protein